jgi:hypothetical protein
MLRLRRLSPYARCACLSTKGMNMLAVKYAMIDLAAALNLIDKGILDGAKEHVQDALALLRSYHPDYIPGNLDNVDNMPPVSYPN